MENILNVNERAEVDEMGAFLKTLPEQAQQYIRGCVDMAKLLSTPTPPTESDKAS